MNKSKVCILQYVSWAHNNKVMKYWERLTFEKTIIGKSYFEVNWYDRIINSTNR
jgi:hypothetical protein